MSRVVTAVLIAVAATIAATAADAQSARKRKQNEITVRGRSYLDAGTMVKPGGYQTNYISIGQGVFAQPVYNNNNWQYGADTLPRRFEPAYAIGR